MARLSTDKLAALKRAFTEDTMTPGQGAQAAGVTYATAKHWSYQGRDQAKPGEQAAAEPGGIREAPWVSQEAKSLCIV